MKNKYAVLSFLKQNNIHYYFDQDESKVTFPCIRCASNICLELPSTKWKCESCTENGNLITLLQMPTNSFVKKDVRKVYHPVEERRAIKQKIKQVIETEDTKYRKLFEKIETLLTYYENKTDEQDNSQKNDIV